MSKVITRFAPSPTGTLHIGGARTALFNYLYARRHRGTYLLRIEDTDKRRSTEQACRDIIDSLNWLALGGDEAPTYQSRNLARHRNIAETLLAQDKAYYCYCSPQELHEQRQKAMADGRSFIGYNRTCRHLKNPPEDKPAAIRIKAPLNGDGVAAPSVIHDLVQGEVTMPADTLDDFVILRQDGTPTYMLSVVVDDYDMNITHIIRGDDHLLNAHRQKILFDACRWPCPQFAHIPLIHGADGKKLSKRLANVSVAEYRTMGYLPQALNNYMLRLGFGGGDHEIISREQTISIFDIARIGKAAAQFDAQKLDFINSRYIQDLASEELFSAVCELLPETLRDTPDKRDIVRNSLPFLKSGRNRLTELAEVLHPYLHYAPEASGAECVRDNAELLAHLNGQLENHERWSPDSLQECLRNFADLYNIKAKDVMRPLRAALLGRVSHPGGVSDILAVLGKVESLRRLRSVL